MKLVKLILVSQTLILLIHFSFQLKYSRIATSGPKFLKPEPGDDESSDPTTPTTDPSTNTTPASTNLTNNKTNTSNTSNPEPKEPTPAAKNDSNTPNQNNVQTNVNDSSKTNDSVIAQNTNTNNADTGNVIVDPDMIYLNNSYNVSVDGMPDDTFDVTKQLIYNTFLNNKTPTDQERFFQNVSKCGVEASAIFTYNLTKDNHMIYIGPKFSIIDMSCLKNVATVILVGMENYWKFFKNIVINKQPVIRESEAFKYAPKRADILSNRFQNFKKVSMISRKNKRIVTNIYYFSFKLYDDSFAMRRVLMHNIEKGNILIIPDFSDANGLTQLGLNMMKCFKTFDMNYLTNYQWKNTFVFTNDIITSINLLYSKYLNHKQLRGGTIFKNNKKYKKQIR